eukprot:304327_1
MNSVNFGKLFKTIKNWDKKQWRKIYTTINKWQKPVKNKSPTKPKTIISSATETPISVDNVCILSDEKDNIYSEETIKSVAKTKSVEQKYMKQETDCDIIDQFCDIAKADRKIAAEFLNTAGWKINDAVELFYQVNGQAMIDEAKENSETHAIIYELGVAFWYWNPKLSGKKHIVPKYNNLKTEILSFPGFTAKDWNKLYDECNVLIKTDQVKKISLNGNHEHIYGIKQNEAITTDHLLSIKLYTDYMWLCKIFCEAFRLQRITQNQYERIQSLQKRNMKVANWAKFLIESVQCYGTFMRKKTKYYRGINADFVFKRFVARFNVPLSTTIDFSAAANFADEGCGLVIQLQRYNDFVSCLDCSIVSDFDEEKEVLFFGSNSILQIASIYQWYNESWTSYRIYIQGIQNILKVSKGSMIWHYANNMKDIIGYLLPNLYEYVNNKPLPPYIISLLNYRLQNVP